MLKYLTIALLLPMSLSAASNEETLQYIIADYQDQCEKAQEDFRDIDYKEGDPSLLSLGYQKTTSTRSLSTKMVRPPLFSMLTLVARI